MSSPFIFISHLLVCRMTKEEWCTVRVRVKVRVQSASLQAWWPPFVNQSTLRQSHLPPLSLSSSSLSLHNVSPSLAPPFPLHCFCCTAHFSPSPCPPRPRSSAPHTRLTSARYAPGLFLSRSLLTAHLIGKSLWQLLSDWLGLPPGWRFCYAQYQPIVRALWCSRKTKRACCLAFHVRSLI